MEIRRLRALPAAVRPRQVDLAAHYGVGLTALRRAVRGLPPYDVGEARPEHERARDERYEREQAGVRVPLAQAASSRAKHAPATVVGQPWMVVRSQGRWARG